MTVSCSSLISCFPVTLIGYILSDFDMVPIAPVIAGIAFVLHSTCTLFAVYGLYLSGSFLFTFIIIIIIRM
jgi:hypothetical protein